jgi:pimeloyl-ACP methyl ester carboxylesterase/DNA-binding CsgD family transcriptional regulator
MHGNLRKLPAALADIRRFVAPDQRIDHEQAIGFLSHRGGRVAYAVSGSGPTLLLDAGRAHHLEAFWRHPPYRRLVRRLGRHFTVVRWDRPGFGLSDRDRIDLSPGAELRLVERLVEAVDARDVAILAAGDAGPGMIRFAARHPDRVARLALFGTAAGAAAPALPEPALRVLARVPAPAIHDVVASALAVGCEPDVASWLASTLAAAASVEAMAELVARAGQEDAWSDAASVRVPALVLHREDDEVVEPWAGRALAAGIESARFVQLRGGAHLVYAGDVEELAAEVVPFLAGGRESSPRTLSVRELEVADLVTLGMTNAEIALRLAIRPRTVDAHLEHIRAKLGVSSRARIAAWVVRRRPAAAVPPGA